MSKKTRARHTDRDGRTVPTHEARRQAQARGLHLIVETDGGKAERWAVYSLATGRHVLTYHTATREWWTRRGKGKGKLNSWFAAITLAAEIDRKEEAGERVGIHRGIVQ